MSLINVYSLINTILPMNHIIFIHILYLLQNLKPDHHCSFKCKFLIAKI